MDFNLSTLCLVDLSWDWTLIPATNSHHLWVETSPPMGTVYPPKPNGNGALEKWAITFGEVGLSKFYGSHTDFPAVPQPVKWLGMKIRQGVEHMPYAERKSI